jgi:hypothetical protein
MKLNVSENSRHMFRPKALRAAGRFKVNTVIPVLFSFKRVSMMSVVDGSVERKRHRRLLKRCRDVNII